MGEEEIDEKTKEQLMEDKLADLYERVNEGNQLLHDLIEYLERTDSNFAMNQATFDTWQLRLERIRSQELKEREIEKAKRLLKNEGYIFAKDQNGLDAAKVKAWVQTDLTDDDIPF